MIFDAVIADWCVSIRSQMRNCASGTIEILRRAFARSHRTGRMCTMRPIDNSELIARMAGKLYPRRVFIYRWEMETGSKPSETFMVMDVAC